MTMMTSTIFRIVGAIAVIVVLAAGLLLSVRDNVENEVTATSIRKRGVDGLILGLKGGGEQPTTCPPAKVLQSDYVLSYYEEEKHAGFYYEIACKDITQPRMCSCITSNKTLFAADDLLVDDFNVQCAGKVYHSSLSFELNVEKNHRGYMIGRWDKFAPMHGVEFPNYIVDVGINPKTKDYDWAIEFQCKQGKDVFGRDAIQYYGLNFYSKTYDDPKVLETMIEVAKSNPGLAPFLDSGSDLFIVDHTQCVQDHDD